MGRHHLGLVFITLKKIINIKSPQVKFSLNHQKRQYLNQNRDVEVIGCIILCKIICQNATKNELLGLK